jgi:hypothetical protein
VVEFWSIKTITYQCRIFLLVGNAMFAGVYYSTATAESRMFSDFLSNLNLGWQLIVAAAVRYHWGIHHLRNMLN